MRGEPKKRVRSTANSSGLEQFLIDPEMSKKAFVQRNLFQLCGQWWLWLVGGAMCPSWKIWQVNGKDDIPYIMENNPNVWNHQPDEWLCQPWISSPMQPLAAFIRDLSKLNQPQLHFNSRFLFCGVTSIIHVQHPGLAYVISRFGGPTSKITRPLRSPLAIQHIQRRGISAVHVLQGREEKTGVSRPSAQVPVELHRSRRSRRLEEPPRTTWISLTQMSII